MMMQQLQDVVSLDTQIQMVQQKLMDLYARRHKLVGNNFLDDLTDDVPLQFNIRRDTVAVLYANLQAVWSIYDITLPPISELTKPMKTAIEILQMSEVQVRKPSLIALPPSSMLRDVLKNSNGLLNNQVEVSYEYTAHSDRQHWQLFILCDDSNIKIESSEDYKKPATIAGLDAGAITLEQTIAAEILGYHVLPSRSWLIFGDQQPNKTDILTASLHGNAIVFGPDQFECLLGDNFIRPVITLNEGS